MKKLSRIIFLLIFIFCGYKFLAYFGLFRARTLDFGNKPKVISVNENGLDFIDETSALTIEEWLKEKNIRLSPNDEIIPTRENKIFSGTNIHIRRAVKIKIEVDGKTIENHTVQNRVERILSENKISLSKLDIVSPDINSLPEENMRIVVTRINVEEKIIPEDIDFQIVYKNNSKLGWREEKIEVSGEKGIREVKYKITYKNGKEISRIALEKNTTKKPTTQVVIKGTRMDLGKAAKGQGTWYAFKGGMFAASTSLPRGAFAKVTSLASGKSIVVQINDYGPQGKGRIIDLDKIAFQKLAPLGAGVIGVKVEEILN
jgi:uncharacterized protein YabE (DUF348 family)